MIAQTLPKSINPTFTYSAFDENDGQWLCIDGQLGDFRILVIISSFSWIQPHIKYIVNISKSHNLATGKTFADTFRVEESRASLTVRILRYEIEKELEAIGWKREFLLLHNLRGLCLYLNFYIVFWLLVRKTWGNWVEAGQKPKYFHKSGLRAPLIWTSKICKPSTKQKRLRENTRMQMTIFVVMLFVFIFANADLSITWLYLYLKYSVCVFVIAMSISYWLLVWERRKR